jgi:hypothetical protein
VRCCLLAFGRVRLGIYLSWRQHRNPSSQQGYLIAAKGIRLMVHDLAGDGYAWAAEGLEWGAGA